MARLGEAGALDTEYARFGRAWQGTVWRGTVRCGKVWSGEAGALANLPMSIFPTHHSEPDTATQRAALLAALLAGRRITPQDALREWGCFRLAARVHELRNAGHDIRSVKEVGDKHCTYWMGARP